MGCSCDSGDGDNYCSECGSELRPKKKRSNLFIYQEDFDKFK